MALLAVWFERRLKSDAIDGAFDRGHASRRKLRTSVLWQDEKGPGAGLLALGGPEEFCFETDQGFGHLPGLIDRINTRRNSQKIFSDARVEITKHGRI